VEHRVIRAGADHHQVPERGRVRQHHPAGGVGEGQAFTGPLALGAPSLQCGKYSDAPAVCNDQTQFFNYSGQNKFTKVAGWLRPPAS
jgi:hypothetical protein